MLFQSLENTVFTGHLICPILTGPIKISIEKSKKTRENVAIMRPGGCKKLRFFQLNKLGRAKEDIKQRKIKIYPRKTTLIRIVSAAPAT